MDRMDGLIVEGLFGVEYESASVFIRIEDSLPEVPLGETSEG